MQRDIDPSIREALQNLLMLRPRKVSIERQLILTTGSWIWSAFEMPKGATLADVSRVLGFRVPWSAPESQLEAMMSQQLVANG